MTERPPITASRAAALVCVVVLTCLSRIPFRLHVPYGLDSVQFVLALEKFDVRLHQPHPPGYFVFVLLGRVLNGIIHDPVQSYEWLNIILSGLTVGLVFLLSEEIFDEHFGLSSAILMSTSALFWHHGEVALSNMTDCFLTCLLAWMCWKVISGRTESLLASALVLGIAGGVRQNTLLFLLPLWLFAASTVPWRKVVGGATCLVLTVCSWYLPMAHLSGGIAAYQRALSDHWLNSNWHGVTVSWIPFNGIVIFYFLLLGTGLGVLALFLSFLFYLEEAGIRKRWQELRFRFFSIWILPPLLFFLLIYSHPTQTGHSLIYLPALVLLLPPSLFWLRKKWQTVSVALFAVTNLGCFLVADTAVSRPRMERYEQDIRQMSELVREKHSPADTILVNMDFMFIGFRVFMYHLPEYRCFQPRLYELSGSKKMFGGWRHQTSLVDQIKVPQTIKYFVTNADELAKNPDLASGFTLDHYSPDHIEVTSSGLKLFCGEISMLADLFPQIPFEIE